MARGVALLVMRDPRARGDRVTERSEGTRESAGEGEAQPPWRLGSESSRVRSLLRRLTLDCRRSNPDSTHPSNRYSDVTNGSRLNIHSATGRPMIVSAKTTATFAQSSESHQPTMTK